MSARPRRPLRLLNRALLAAAGLLSTAAVLPVLAAARERGALSFDPVPAALRGLPGPSPAQLGDRLRQDLLPGAADVPVHLVAAAVLAVAALCWLRAQTRARSGRVLPLSAGSSRLRTRALAEAVAADAEAVPGVRSARVAVRGRGGRRWLRLTLTLAPDARPGAVLHGVEQRALVNARTSLAAPQLRLVLRIRVARHRPERLAVT